MKSPVLALMLCFCTQACRPQAGGPSRPAADVPHAENATSAPQAQTQYDESPATGVADRHVAAVLAEIRSRDKSQLAVSEADGRFLRLLIAAAGAQRALEIGAASGYSAIWMGLALRETGGTLVTIEYDTSRARKAVENVRRAGLAEVVTVVAGDAFAEVPKLAGTFDFVFLDAWKRDYRRFFDMVLPRLDRGGLFVAHNVVNKRDEMRDFLTAIEREPLWSAIVSPSNEGMSVTYRR